MINQWPVPKVSIEIPYDEMEYKNSDSDSDDW